MSLGVTGRVVIKVGVDYGVSVCEYPQAGTWVVIELAVIDHVKAEFAIVYVLSIKTPILNIVSMQFSIII